MKPVALGHDGMEEKRLHKPAQLTSGCTPAAPRLNEKPFCAGLLPGKKHPHFCRVRLPLIRRGSSGTYVAPRGVFALATASAPATHVIIYLGQTQRCILLSPSTGIPSRSTAVSAGFRVRLIDIWRSVVSAATAHRRGRRRTPPRGRHRPADPRDHGGEERFEGTLEERLHR